MYLHDMVNLFLDPRINLFVGPRINLVVCNISSSMVLVDRSTSSFAPFLPCKFVQTNLFEYRTLGPIGMSWSHGPRRVVCIG